MKILCRTISIAVTIYVTTLRHAHGHGDNIRFLRQECKANCDCFVEKGVIGEEKAPTIAVCVGFNGASNSAYSGECQSRCVSDTDAAKLINEGAYVSVYANNNLSL